MRFEALQLCEPLVTGWKIVLCALDTTLRTDTNASQRQRKAGRSPDSGGWVYASRYCLFCVRGCRGLEMLVNTSKPRPRSVRASNFLLQMVQALTNSSGQILFRLNSVQAASLRGAKKAEFTIKRTLQLRKLPERPEEGLPKPSFSARYSQGADEMPIDAEPVHLSQVQASIENNRKDIDRIDTAGFQIVSALDKAVRRVENETSKLQKSVQDLRKLSEGSNDDIMFLKTELNNIGMTAGNAATESISRFETQVHSISDAVPALREELKAYSTQSRKDIRRLDSQLSQAKQEIEQLKGINKSDALAVKEHAKELKSLRAEMLTLRDSLDQPSASQPLEKPMGFPRKELDILTDNIARLGNRASQVETLQMQLEILKGRVERVETEKLNASMTTIHPSNHKKRPRYDVQQSELSTEIGMLPRDGPLEVSDVKGPRLMRSGAMDRRTEKRISKRS